jgi:hypothetical protein
LFGAGPVSVLAGAWSGGGGRGGGRGRRRRRGWSSALGQWTSRQSPPGSRSRTNSPAPQSTPSLTLNPNIRKYLLSYLLTLHTKYLLTLHTNVTIDRWIERHKAVAFQPRLLHRLTAVPSLSH